MNDTNEQLGEVVEASPHQPIATGIWRYVLNANGEKTGRIRRVGGRKVSEVASDLCHIIQDMNIEWATLGQGYKYRQGNDTPDSECADYNSIVVYVTHGGSEGHLVHVDMTFVPEDGDGTFMIHKKLFMVKTFAGAAYATRIAQRLMRALGVL